MGATPSASYSVTLRVEYPTRTGSLGEIFTTIGETGGDVGAVDIVQQGERSIRDITVNARDSEHGQQIADAIFRGALNCRAREINEEMKLAARALAEVIPEEDLSEDYIIPNVFDERIVPDVAEAVAEAGRDSGVSRPSLEEGDPMESPSLSQG